ncbi:MAG TPA: hypothetical protein PLA19_04015 [Candidatus Pacearchaeota archaeon]|nr:hypothetical protein [Candidatus Pacearchaeota archaeon]
MMGNGWEKTGLDSLKNKQYLGEANKEMPVGWRIMEATRIADTTKKPTFALYLVTERNTAVYAWPIITSMPRRVLRKFVAAVERQGFGALFDLNLEPSSYTAMVGEKGYEPETTGLLEALLEDGLHRFLINCFSKPNKTGISIHQEDKSEIDFLLELED